MDYQVWTKEEYGDLWAKKDCGDLPAAQREIMEAIKKGAEPLLTVVVPFDFSIKVKEDKIGEAIKSKARPDKGARAESKVEAGPGAPEPVSELDQGSGDSGADNSVQGK